MRSVFVDAFGGFELVATDLVAEMAHEFGFVSAIVMSAKGHSLQSFINQFKV